MSKSIENMVYQITHIQAQQIIDIACDTWKKTLASKWAVDIVMGKPIEITGEFYREMRCACTVPQHKLFDTIFGPVFSQGDWVTIINTSKTFSDGSITKCVINVAKDFWLDLDGEFAPGSDKKIYNSWNPNFLRLVTEEEIEKVKQSIVPEIGKKYKLKYTRKFCHWYNGTKSFHSDEMYKHEFIYLGNVKLEVGDRSIFICTTTDYCSYLMVEVGKDYEYIVDEVNT